MLLPPLSKKPKIQFLGFFFISLFILAFSIIQMPLGKGRRITPPRSPRNPELHLNTHK
ncbi:multidrug transporter [Staphylococcus hominis]|nr:multidrug transporter [Staphylococcus hominis]